MTLTFSYSNRIQMQLTGQKMAQEEFVNQRKKNSRKGAKTQRKTQRKDTPELAINLH